MPNSKKQHSIAHATVLSAQQHQINQHDISRNAIKVTQTLQQAGFAAFVVGGAIRDSLLGEKPKDFDVATSATPEQCRRLFKNARIIGRRFQIVHVRFGREVIEVTTFRANHEAKASSPKQNKHSAASEQGLLLRDNVFGNINEDAERRDFSCNALYYNPETCEVLDFCNGIEDLEQQSIRLIGDPDKRYQEDPVRMLRAIRFSCKLGFKIEPQTHQAIGRNAELLAQINHSRLFDESLKLFLSGYAYPIFQALETESLLPMLLHDSEDILSSNFNRSLINFALKNTDKRIRQNKSINPAFLWAVFLWPTLQAQQNLLIEQKYPPMAAMYEAAQQVFSIQCRLTSIPKRLQIIIKEIWELQLRLPQLKSKQVIKTLSHKRFRAGYDFLLLREQAGENLNDLGKFWTDAQKDPSYTQYSTAEINQRPAKRRRPRR